MNFYEKVASFEKKKDLNTVQKKLEQISKLTTTLYNLYLKIYVLYMAYKWRSRINKSLSNDYTNNKLRINSDNKYLLYNALEAMRKIVYTPDTTLYKKRDHWPTFEEVEKTMQDDCDGQAVFMFGYLLKQGINPDDLLLLVCRGHMFLGVYDCDKHFFWILDNGYLTPLPTPAHTLFPITRDNKELTIIAGFNLSRTVLFEKFHT